MLCAACNKESSNQRVCPYCFTPYAADAPQARASTGAMRQAGTSRQTGATPAVPGAHGAGLGGALARARAFVMRQSPIVRWSGFGILVVGLIWVLTGEQNPALTAPPGEVPANIITTPMSRDEAVALIARTRETALVEEQSGEVFVSYVAAYFPLQPEGQLALAQQFTRADEIVEGRKRRINFYNPNGRLFAQSDGVRGVRFIQ
jgi:hypothetical protein